MTLYAEYAIPFDGFYETDYDVYADNEIENLAEEYNLDYDAIWAHVDCKQWRETVAKQYASLFFGKVGIAGQFVGLVSPKFYNFETDRIFVKSSLVDLFNFRDKVLADADKVKQFCDFVKEHYTSRSGFISFVSTDVKSWDWREDARVWTILFQFYDKNYFEYDGWSSDYDLIDEIKEYLDVVIPDIDIDAIVANVKAVG